MRRSSLSGEVRSVRAFAERIPTPVVPQGLDGRKMNALLANLVAAPGMRTTMFESLRAIVVDAFRTRGLEYDAARFRRSSLDDERLEQIPTEINVVIN